MFLSQYRNWWLNITQKTVLKIQKKDKTIGEFLKWKCLYGLTDKEISEKLKADFNIDVDKKKILLDETIKTAGVTNVELKLNEGVTAKVKVMIVAE